MTFARCLTALALALSLSAAEYDYRVLATKKTSTLEKEMNEAAEAGYLFRATMGGDTAAGNEAVAVMVKSDSGPRRYRLLATSKTSTMEKEMNEAGAEGFRYVGQTVFSSSFGGREVVVILERNPTEESRSYSYKLLATNRTSTMEKELKQAGAQGYTLLGLTVAKTSFGGNEIVSLLMKE